MDNLEKVEVWLDDQSERELIIKDAKLKLIRMLPKMKTEDDLDAHYTERELGQLQGYNQAIAEMQAIIREVDKAQ